MTSSPPLVLLLLLAPLLPASLLVLADISAAYHNYLAAPTTCGISPLNSRQNESCLHVARSAPYIVNGHDAEYGQWPFLAWVSVDYKSCSGVIVGSDLVVTAAHCVEHLKFEHLSKPLELDSTISAFVNVGKISRNERDSFEAYHDIKVIQAGAYFVSRGLNEENPDFARLWLRKPIKFNDYVQPVCIPSRPEMVYSLIAGPLFFIGNGVKYETGVMDTHNKKTQWIQMKTPDPTFRALRRSEHENMSYYTFVPYEKNDQKVCRGDSGGPLVALDENRRWSLVGLAHKSVDLCRPGTGYRETDIFVLMAKIVGIFDKNFKPKPDDWVKEWFTPFNDGVPSPGFVSEANKTG